MTTLIMSSDAALKVPNVKSAASTYNSDLVIPNSRDEAAFGTFDFKSKGSPSIRIESEPVVDSLARELGLVKEQNQSLKDAALQLESELKRLNSKGKDDGELTRQFHTMLTVYDERIRELESSVSKYKVEMQSLSLKYQESLTNNQELKNSLKDKYEREITGATESKAKSDSRIALLTQENEVLTQQQRSLYNEVENLRDALVRKTKELCSAVNGSTDAQEVVQSLKFDLERLNESNGLLEKDLRACMTDLTQFSNENEKLQADARRCQLESKTWASKANELKKALDQVTANFQDQVQESSLMVNREREYLENLRAVEADLEDYKVKYTQALREVASLREDNDKVYKRYRNVEERNFELEEKHVEIFKQQQKFEEKAQNIKLEHEKSKLREQQLIEENKRLQKSLENQINKDGEAAEQTEKRLRAEWAAEKRQLTQEIHDLEVANGQHQSLIDRAVRDKRTAEEELSQIHAQLPTETSRLNSTVEELSAKLRSSERERYDLANMLESVKQSLHREQNKKQTEKEDYANRSSELHRRLRRAEVGLEEVKEEKVRLLTKLSDSEHQYRLLEEKYNGLVHHHAVEVESLQNRFRDEIGELNSQLEFSHTSNKKTAREMQQLILDNKKAADKWQQESKRIADQYLEIVESLKRQHGLLQHKLSDVNLQLNSSQMHRSELSHQLTEEKKSQAKLALLLEGADSRAEQLQKQVEELLERETEWLRQKRRIQSDVEKIKHEHQVNAIKDSNTLRPEANLTGQLQQTRGHVKSLQESIERVKQRLQESKSKV